MKKIFISLALLLGLNFVASAQAFQEGTHNVSLGYGFGNFAQSVFSTYKNNTGYDYSPLGPLFLKYEYGISDNIGIGMNIAYVGADVKWEESDFSGGTYSTTVDWNSFSALLRMNIHFGSSDFIDPYWGFGLGYRDASWKWTYSDPSITDGLSFNNPINIGFETTLGARFFFTDNLGAYAEAGFAKGALQIGLDAKF